jgi:uroporphyrin-III C-methyltransferase
MARRDASCDRGLVALAGGASLSRARGAGKVWLVGAGPGDPELLTLKAARVLAAADVVVHDRLVSQDILDFAPASARRLYVGKRKSSHSLPQGDVNDLLVALAREGLTVVRLKGGDPFLFGRGGEELLACRAAGVECEVIPGISAAVAASASVGAPLTHRGMAQAVTFVTGHAQIGADGAAQAPDLDWAALAKANHTVAVYMGLSTAPMIAARLMAAGRAGSTPVVVVENASRAEERRVLTTLAGLPDAVRALDGPAMLIIGEVAALAQISPPAQRGEGTMRSMVRGARLGADLIRGATLADAPSTIPDQVRDGPPPPRSLASGSARPRPGGRGGETR